MMKKKRERVITENYRMSFMRSFGWTANVLFVRYEMVSDVDPVSLCGETCCYSRFKFPVEPFMAESILVKFTLLQERKYGENSKNVANISPLYVQYDKFTPRI